MAARFDEWHEAVSSAFVPLHAAAPRRDRFAGELATAALGDLALASVAGTAVVVDRTPGLIHGSDSGYLKLGVQAHGRCLLTQDGRCAELLPGDLALYDTSRPYRLVFEQDFRMLVLMLPRDLLPLRPRQLGEVTARRISGSSGLGAVFAPFLSALATRSLAGDVQASPQVRDAVLDLLEATCRSVLGDPTGVPDAGREALLLRLQGWVDERLAEQDLTAAAVAEAHHVSVRYVQKLFQAEGTTLSAWIRNRRLERCHRDLVDPTLRDVPVAAIAARWGFGEATTFTRAYRRRFGTVPSQTRRGA